MIDVVIPYVASRYPDLKYTLRSIEQHLTGVGQVYLVGDDPGQEFKNIWRVIHPNAEGWHHCSNNIFNKILRACQVNDITDTFLVVHDDHILRTAYAAETFPYYYDNTPSSRTEYGHLIANTLRVVPPHTHWFDVHCPMRVNKRCFIELTVKLTAMPWPYWGYGVKTVYAAAAQEAGIITADECIQTLDCKLRQPYMGHIYDSLLKLRPWYSYGDEAQPGIHLYLAEQYPQKSKYEL